MQQAALKELVDILANEEEVKAVFVKGSFGRREDDLYSDIDLYCLVDEKDVTKFLPKRLALLSAYKDVLYSEELVIIAPQLIIVYDNLLHVDLFTVTEKSFKQSDYFLVLYDPWQLLEKYRATQKLTMTDEEYGDQVIDLIWFLFQYRKAALRSNGVWAAAMLQQVTEPLARMLLHHHNPERAQLGLKRAEQLLPSLIFDELTDVLENVTPEGHSKAVAAILRLLEKERIFLEEHLRGKERRIIYRLYQKLITDELLINT
ncbi:nucleotidyltransferase domain-containing protein [Terribacillus sp. 179-K 1B1 HS]|uniref:nucleotidyltransferase domain-containing protein n=1 Tax=Terribacillus sp. 179-K 1B1 HS TaxID=3142388 RepID=UPI0039A23C82